MSRKQIENSLVLKQHGFDARTIRETPIRTIARRRQISVGEMLEVWGVDSLQEMLDTSPLQHPSQVVRINAGEACPMAPRKSRRNQPRALELARTHCIKTTILRLKFNVKFDHDELHGG